MNVRQSLFKYGAAVVALHVLGAGLLLSAVGQYPTLVGLAALAYTFGLRHAFDADHIAAIDNTVRKLRQDEEDPMGVGFFFSLGHSSIVIIMVVATALATQWAQRSMPFLHSIGGVVTTIFAGLFLYAIGIINLIVLRDIYQVFKDMRSQSINEEELEELLLSRGFMSRLVRPLFKLITRSWHVYPVGVIFGFSFDTASEVALLAISAGAANNAIPLSGILALPILFAAGMSLMDTADGAFMTTAYDWAFSNPVRKVYYNLTVTGLSVMVALLIGTIEIVQVLTSKLGLSKGMWGWLQNLNFGTMGYLVVGLFIITWAVSYGAWKLFNIESEWSLPG